jgi:urea transport system permease protein
LVKLLLADERMTMVQILEMRERGTMRGNLYHNKPAQWLAYLAFFAFAASLPFWVEDAFALNQFARYGVFAMLAVSVSLVWGHGGILSLGQGIAFGMGAYGMGATMQMQYQDPISNPIPSFMLTNELSQLPGIWEPFWNTGLGLLLAVGVPTAFFILFGLLMFQARIAGAFVAIMTLAMLGAWYNMAYDMQPYTAGFNGISPPLPFSILGFQLDPYDSPAYWVTCAILAFVTLSAKGLMESKFGLILRGVRDDAERARFLGYSVAYYQVVIFTIAGFVAALAGVVWVMLTQYVSPTSMEIVLSISMVIWAAIGGRLSLFGAMIGALFVNSIQSYVGDELQATWFVILGALFVVIVRFLPRGLAGLFESVIGLIPIHNQGGSVVRQAKESAE